MQSKNSFLKCHFRLHKTEYVYISNNPDLYIVKFQEQKKSLIFGNKGNTGVSINSRAMSLIFVEI